MSQFQPDIYELREIFQMFSASSNASRVANCPNAFVILIMSRDFISLLPLRSPHYASLTALSKRIFWIEAGRNFYTMRPDYFSECQTDSAVGTGKKKKKVSVTITCLLMETKTVRNCTVPDQAC